MVYVNSYIKQDGTRVSGYSTEKLTSAAHADCAVELAAVSLSSLTQMMARPPAPHAHLAALCNGSDAENVMSEVFDVLTCRDEMSAAAFADLTEDDVDAFYDRFVGPAADKIEDWFARSVATANVDDTEGHLKAVSAEAGYDTVMPAFLRIISDRESVDGRKLNALTADGIDALYNEVVGPAIDGIADQLIRNDESHPAVQEFLRSEHANHRATHRDDARKGRSTAPLTWSDAIDSLDCMPDDTIAEISGSDDTDAVRDRLRAIAGRRGYSSHAAIS